MTNRKYFAYVGSSGFPYGLAEVKRMTLISKSLIIAGNSVTVICEKGVHNSSAYPDLKVSGSSEGIDYIYTSGSPFRNDHFLKRNLLKIKGRFNEIRLIYKLRRHKKLDYAILSIHNFYNLVYYIILSKLFGFKTILNHVEFYSAIKFKWSQKRRWLNDKLYDNYAPRLADISFPISEYLIKHLNKIVPGKKYIKVPILAEFEKYDNTHVLQEPSYFMFSGAADYFEIVRFIIGAFNLLQNSNAYLYLAIKGNEPDLKRITEYINSNPDKERIKFFTTLNEKQLYNYYKNAKALLIPLRPTVQDEARFPHKIGEYLASGNPAISTNYGEVKHYFKDQQTMLIADSYDINDFAAKMQYILDFPDDAKKIGERGKQLALENFNYNTYGEKITSFLNAVPA